MTGRGETGTTHFSLTGFFSKGSHSNGLIYDGCVYVYKMSIENINFPGSNEQKEFEKEIRVNGFWERGKNLKNLKK